ncbi:MAG TPA: outer membrane protein assembly factor BamD [Bryobacteraceae bacterium]|nr:outer membrane protein assembly factor BamD [Bryobacteraceae bacterium]
MARYILTVVLIAGLLSSCGFRRKKYDNPITKDTKQPDKVLYDRAIGDIEHSRFEVARITLNTLINTYDQSEFLAKAKLAIADSWYREGGAAGLAQAEAEYKDFILFYPTMEEAAESQQKICMIHYKQMDKADRDESQALRAEDECRQLIVQFPNSKFVAETQQLLRNIQEALGDAEYRVGSFYYKRGSNPAAANRFTRLIDQYPLYSKADAALWDLGESYHRMGNRFRKEEGAAYAKIVRDYPLSDYVTNAKKKLAELEMPIPEADVAAYNRMKWEQENRQKSGMITRTTGFLRRGPDMSTAARSGTPAMTTARPTVPVSVPQPAGAAGFSGDVTATTAPNSDALDKNPDARANPPAAGDAKPADGKTADGQATTDQSTPATTDTKAKKKKKEKKPKPTPATTAPATNPPSTNPPSANPPAAKP